MGIMSESTPAAATEPVTALAKLVDFEALPTPSVVVCGATDHSAVGDARFL